MQPKKSQQATTQPLTREPRQRPFRPAAGPLPLLAVALLLTTLAPMADGCTRVKPWERDILSKRTMTFDKELEENALDHTFYNAREGAAGGFGTGGGGCGCN